MTHETPQPKRQLGLGSATALVIANMVGTGVFTTSGFLIADLKSPWFVMANWVVGGVIAALGALCYGALARRIPESGGEYVFLSRTLHPAAGFLAGWVSLLVGFSAPVAAAAFGFGQYAKPWLGGCPAALSGSVLVLVFALVHATHVRGGAQLQNLAVLFKLALILAFVAFAASSLKIAPAPTWSTLPVPAFCVSLVWVSFSYAGWNAAVYIGGEIQHPERNLPRALIAGTAVVTLIYVMLNAVFLFGAPAENLAGKLEVGRIVAEAIGGPTWGHAMAGLVAVVLVSSVSSMLMAGPRVYAQMAADGYLPAWLICGSGPPRASIALQTSLALVLLWTATYEGLLTYIGFTLGISTAATVAGLVRLRLREGPALRVPGWPWVPLTFLLAVSAMTLFTILRRPTESCVGLLTLVAGWVAWTRSPRGRRGAV